MPRQRRAGFVDARYRDGAIAGWVIRVWDPVLKRTKNHSTELPVDATEEQKAIALGEFFAKQHDPSPKGTDNPNEALVADCLNKYVEKRDQQLAKNPIIEGSFGWKRRRSREKEFEQMIARLNTYFGPRKIGEVTGKVQKEYAATRTASMARRELQMLSAAINNYFVDERGGFHMQFSAVLPDEETESRERHLSRPEAAKIVKAAWRKRQKNRGGSAGRFTGKHTARFTLIGIYVGGRATMIASAATTPTIGRPYIDYDRGLFIRKFTGRVESNKTKNTNSIPLPPRLMIHLRRWKRLGISDHSVIEWEGKPVLSPYKGFVQAVKLAGLGTDVIPHTLRHTAVTWYLGSGVEPKKVAEYVGMDEKTMMRVYRHLMPGHFKQIMKASYRFGKVEA